MKFKVGNYVTNTQILKTHDHLFFPDNTFKVIAIKYDRYDLVNKNGIVIQQVVEDTLKITNRKFHYKQ